jgi:hypothetical protein
MRPHPGYQLRVEKRNEFDLAQISSPGSAQTALKSVLTLL